MKYEYSRIKGKYKGRIRNGKPHGLGMLVNHQQSIMAEWKNGAFHGKVFRKWKNHCLQYLSYKNGRPDGISLTFYKNGERREYKIEDGNCHGKYRHYGASGKLEEEGKYLYGREARGPG